MHQPRHSGPPRLAGKVAPDEFDGAFAREATLDDAPEMLRVYEAAFDRWPPYDLDVPALDHLRWKMATADADPISPHDVVIAEGVIAAAMVAWVGEGRIGSQTLVTDNAVDLAVHPDYRGKRFGRLIALPSEVRNEGRADYFSFDGSPTAAAVLHMYADGGVVREVQVWDRALGAIRTLTSLRHRRGQLLLGRQILRHQLARRAVHRLTRRHSALRSRARDIEVRPVERFDERADALCETASRQFDIARHRTASWLNWRYADPRAGRILTLGAFAGDALLGYIAIRRRPRETGNGTASVLDVLGLPERPAAITALLDAAAAHMYEEGASHLSAWLAPDHPYCAAFEASGLTNSATRRAVKFGTKHLDDSPRALETLDNPSATMHVTLGDFDWA